MIVLLDIEKQILTLYGRKGMVEIPFVKAGEMYDYLESDNVTYITNAMECNAAEILKVIKGMGVVIQDDIVETGIKYLHTPGEGSIYINENFQFKGKFDCKMIDENITHIIETSPLVQNLIRSKKIEIIGERKRASLSKQYKQWQNKQLENQAASDGKLGDMIIGTSVADFDANASKIGGHNDIIEVDLERGGRVGTGAGVSGPTFNTMSELMDNIDGLD